MIDNKIDIVSRIRVVLSELGDDPTPHDLLRSLFDNGLVVVNSAEHAVLSAVMNIAQEDVAHWTTFTDDSKEERALLALGQAELKRRSSR